jgi:hypothetical protein
MSHMTEITISCMCVREGGKAKLQHAGFTHQTENLEDVICVTHCLTSAQKQCDQTKEQQMRAISPSLIMRNQVRILNEEGRSDGVPALKRDHTDIPQAKHHPLHAERKASPRMTAKTTTGGCPPFARAIGCSEPESASRSTSRRC